VVAANERDARRESRALLAGRDGGDRVVPAGITLDAFLELEYLPHIDALGDAGVRSRSGVKLDRITCASTFGPPWARRSSAAATPGTSRFSCARKPRKRRAKNAPERPLSESTLHYALTVLRDVYRLALSRRLDSRACERIAENLYRRRTKRGEIVFETKFRDVDGRWRSQTLGARV
jgi:hypothetical protein